MGQYEGEKSRERSSCEERKGKGGGGGAGSNRQAKQPCIPLPQALPVCECKLLTLALHMNQCGVIPVAVIQPIALGH